MRMFDKCAEVVFNFNSSLTTPSHRRINLTKSWWADKLSILCSSGRCSLKIRIQRTDKCEHRQFQEWLSKALKKLTKFALWRKSRKTKVNSFSFNSGEERQTEIELKSLILAQIERWRHALHMQVERQHRELAPGWRVANGWVMYRNVPSSGG